MKIRNYIGFDRTLKLNWLNRVAQLSNQPTENIKQELDLFLQEHISGKDARRKANDALRRLWVSCDQNKLTKKARELFRSFDGSDRICLHFGMCMMASPFFRDVVQFGGMLIKLQGEISAAQIRTRIYEKWGERSTLQYAIQRVFASLRDWGLLIAKSQGCYLPRTLTISNTEIIDWIVASTVFSHLSRRIPLQELEVLPELALFELESVRQVASQSQFFTIHREGSNQDYLTV